jgi:hypothetical protein
LTPGAVPALPALPALPLLPTCARCCALPSSSLVVRRPLGCACLGPLLVCARPSAASSAASPPAAPSPPPLLLLLLLHAALLVPPPAQRVPCTSSRASPQHSRCRRQQERPAARRRRLLAGQTRCMRARYTRQQYKSGAAWAHIRLSCYTRTERLLAALWCVPLTTVPPPRLACAAHRPSPRALPAQALVRRSMCSVRCFRGGWCQRWLLHSTPAATWGVSLGVVLRCVVASLSCAQASMQGKRQQHTTNTHASRHTHTHHEHRLDPPLTRT